MHFSRFARICLLFVSIGLAGGSGGARLLAASAASAAQDEGWVTAWTTAPLAETPGKDTPPLLGATVRQVVRVTAAGPVIRLRIGNYFGAEPLVLRAVRVGLAGENGTPRLETTHGVRFGGSEELTVPAGGARISDPVELPVQPGADLAVEFKAVELPRVLTGHSAARAISYLVPAEAADPAGAATQPVTFTRWYFLTGIDVLNTSASAVAILGDSITDGYGCPPFSYARWPDALARRLQANPSTAHLAVLNLGIGGNRLLRDGLGPRALSRVQRDIFEQHGVRSLVVMLGINDIGTRIDARKKGQPYASADDLIGALRHIAEQARERGLKVIGATVTPYAGAGFYWSEDGERDRQAVNAWIRTTDAYSAVIDFDQALRDPAAPERLAAAFDSGDHLHPSLAGYAEMARVVDLSLFAPVEATAHAALP